MEVQGFVLRDHHRFSHSYLPRSKFQPSILNFHFHFFPQLEILRHSKSRSLISPQLPPTSSNKSSTPTSKLLHAIMVSLLRLIAAAICLTLSLAHAIPARNYGNRRNIARRSVSLDLTRNPDYAPNGPAAYARALKKWGAEVPSELVHSLAAMKANGEFFHARSEGSKKADMVGQLARSALRVLEATANSSAGLGTARRRSTSMLILIPVRQMCKFAADALCCAQCRLARMLTVLAGFTRPRLESMSPVAAPSGSLRTPRQPRESTMPLG